MSEKFSVALWGGPADGDCLELDHEPRIYGIVKIAAAYKANCIYTVMNRIGTTKFQAQFMGLEIHRNYE